jgi:hypothetical protein
MADWAAIAGHKARSAAFAPTDPAIHAATPQHGSFGMSAMPDVQN